MTLAIFGTIFLYRDSDGISWVIMHGSLVDCWLEAIVGTLAANKVKMTAMPEMVSLI